MADTSVNPLTRVCKIHGILPLSEFSVYDAPAYKGESRWKRYKCKLCRKLRDENRTEYLRLQRKAWGKGNKDKLLAYNKTYLSKKPEKREQFNGSRNERRRETRLEVLTHYSGGPPSCRCCSETRLQFLVLDHENGGGNEERRRLKKVTDAFYKWVRSQGYPRGYRVLCHNCNMSIGAYGKCPHEDERVKSAA